MRMLVSCRGSIFFSLFCFDPSIFRKSFLSTKGLVSHENQRTIFIIVQNKMEQNLEAYNNSNTKKFSSVNEA